MRKGAPPQNETNKIDRVCGRKEWIRKRYGANRKKLGKPFPSNGSCYNEDNNRSGNSRKRRMCQYGENHWKASIAQYALAGQAGGVRQAGVAL